ncbi:MAG: hypothetical protein GY696_33785 [Gammaproteobacteria bacterium]|nr:hypothetical protein [Gammaproteobacteria bacterium]
MTKSPNYIRSGYLRSGYKDGFEALEVLINLYLGIWVLQYEMSLNMG